MVPAGPGAPRPHFVRRAQQGPEAPARLLVPTCLLAIHRCRGHSSVLWEPSTNTPGPCVPGDGRVTTPPRGVMGRAGSKRSLWVYQPRVTDRLRLARFSVEGLWRRVTTMLQPRPQRWHGARRDEAPILILATLLGVARMLLDDLIEATQPRPGVGTTASWGGLGRRGRDPNERRHPPRASCPELVRARFEWPYPVRLMVTQNGFGEGLAPCLLSIITAGRGGSEKENRP